MNKNYLLYNLRVKQFAQKIILFYLRILAKIQLLKIKPIVIGIAGSTGKTSLNYLASEVIALKYKVKASKGKNSETGIPFDLLDIELKRSGFIGWIEILLKSFLAIFTNWRKYDIYLLEMGIDGPFEPKNMSYLLKIIKPKIALVTNISFEHSLYFDPLVKELSGNKKFNKILELTAREENLILTTLNANCQAIINLDDPKIVEIIDKIKAPKITISLKEKNADFYCSEFILMEQTTRMTIVAKNKKYNLEIPTLLPKHFAYEFLFVIAIANFLNISIDACLKIIANHVLLAPSRASIFKGIRNTTLIDSSYNASTEPMLDALDFLNDLGKDKKRKIAILGDMRELGSLSKFSHEKIAKKILKTVNLAILIGPLTQKFIVPILKKNNFKFEVFKNFSQAKQFILDAIKENDLILIKGSQNTLFLERVVEMLLANKNDVSKLCRRGEFWDKKRSESL